MQRRQDSHRLQHHGCADAVVRRAGRVVPRIVMPAEHYDFVLLVAARNFSNRVVSRGAFGILLVLNVDAQGHRRAVIHDSRNAPVVFIAHHQRGDRPGRIVGAVLLRDDHAVRAARVVHAHQCAVVHQELVHLPRNFRARQLAFRQLGLLRKIRARSFGIESRFPFIFRPPHRRWMHVFRHFPVLADENNRSAHFVFHGIQIRIEFRLRRLLRLLRLHCRRHRRRCPFRFGRRRSSGAKEVESGAGWRRESRRIEPHHLRGDNSFCAGSPGQRLDHQLPVEWRNCVRQQFNIFPAGDRRSRARRLKSPRFQVRVRQSPRRHRLHRPVVRRFQIRRAGDARAVDVRDLVNDPHDL